MKYEVVWTTSAESDLANVWLDAVDRSAVSLAADEIDQELASTPLSFGIARKSSVDRYTEVGPLGVAYEVVEDDKRVYVRHVYLCD